MAAEAPRKYGGPGAASGASSGSSAGPTSPSPSLGSILSLSAAALADDTLGAAFPPFATSTHEQMQLHFQQQMQMQQQQFAASSSGGGGASSRSPPFSLETAIGPAASTLLQVQSDSGLLDRPIPSLPATSLAMGMGMSTGMPLAPPQFIGERSGHRQLPTPRRQQQQQPLSGTAATSPTASELAPSPQPQLYKTSKMRRPELWQFIRLVVPDPPDVAAGKTYTNQDAREAYCLKCKLLMHYNTGSSNNVSRHMAKFHPIDLASYEQKVADKKKRLRAMGGHVGAKRKLRSNGATSNDHGAGRHTVGASPVAVRANSRRPHPGAYSGGESGAVELSDESDEMPPPKGKRRLRRTDSMETDGDGLSTTFPDELEMLEEPSQRDVDTLNALVARWVCKHYHPLGITEDPELQEIIRFALSVRRNVTLPSQNTVRASVESLTARTRLDMLRQFSREMMFFAMATEVWTTADNEVFMSISVHYNTEAFEKRHFTLDVREFNSPLTPDAKRELMDMLLTRWNLDSRYLCSMLWQPHPSNAHNDITMVHTQQTEGVAHAFQFILAPLLHRRRELSAEGMRAFYHDNLVNKAIDSMLPEFKSGAAFLSTQVEIFRELALFLTSQPRAAARLGKLLAGTSSPHHHAHRLVTDTKANWVSTLDMLKRLLKKKAAIGEFFAYVGSREGQLEFHQYGRFSLSAPTREQWCAIECLLLLLQPFESVAAAIGKEKYATLALTLPLLQFLKRDLEKGSDFQRVFAAYGLSADSSLSDPAEGATVADTIRSSLEVARAYLYRQFAVHFARHCNGLMWLSQLDPRFVRMRFLSDEERATCKTRLGERCYLISHFLESMANQHVKGGSGTLAASSSGGSSSNNGGGVTLDGSSANTAFLDFAVNREDHDTSSFLRELLFDDAHDDAVPQPPQAPQQHSRQDEDASARDGHPQGASSGPRTASNVGGGAAYATAGDGSSSPSSPLDEDSRVLAASTRSIDGSGQEAALRQRVFAEVDAYYEDVSSSDAPAVRDPMRWWREHGDRYPLLAPLARKWLSSVGSVRPTTEALPVLTPSDRGTAGPGANASPPNSNGGGGRSGSGSGGAAHSSHTGPSPILGVPQQSEPDLIRDVVFVHDNC